MNDQELYKEYREYFISALSILENALSQGSAIKIKFEQDIEFDIRQGPNDQRRGYSCSFPLISSQDYFGFISERSDEFKKVNNYENCLKRFRALSPEGFYEQGFLINPIVDYVKKQKSFIFDEAEFLSIYTEIEGYFFRETTLVSYQARLISFGSDVEEIVLEDNIRIKRYTVDECKKLWKESVFQRSFMNVTVPIDFKIEVILDLPKNYLQSINKEGDKKVKYVLSLLRLFKSKNTLIGPINEEAVSWVPMGGRRFNGVDSIRSGEHYFLKQEEIPQLLNLWQKLKEVNMTNAAYLEVAINRYNYAHERQEWEDKLLDIMIGFEALFSDGNVELQYKCSLRTALFIGGNQADRIKIFNVIKNAYGFRSKVVHGGKIEDSFVVDKEEMDKGAFINLLKGYLSLSIKKFIELSTQGKSAILHEIHKSSLKDM